MKNFFIVMMVVVFVPNTTVIASEGTRFSLPIVWASTAPTIEKEDEIIVLPPPPPLPPVPPPIKVTPLVVKKIIRDPAPAGRTIPSQNGKRMCPKNLKDDHPSKSKHNKKGHMDMECCPDPDEIPNNNCNYSQYSVERNGKWIIPFLQVSNL